MNQIPDIIMNWSSITWSCLAIGICSLLLLLLFKSVVSPAVKQHLWPSMPMEVPVDIIVVIVATIVSWGFDFPNPESERRLKQCTMVQDSLKMGHEILHYPMIERVNE